MATVHARASLMDSGLEVNLLVKVRMAVGMMFVHLCVCMCMICVYKLAYTYECGHLKSVIFKIMKTMIRL